MTEFEINRRVAEKLCEDFVWEGRSFREGEFVALLDGRIVAVDDDSLGAIRALRAIDSDPQRGMVVEVTHPEADVII